MRSRTIILVSFMSCTLLQSCIRENALQVQEPILEVKKIIISPPALATSAAAPLNTGLSPYLFLGQADGKLASLLISFSAFPDSLLSVDSAEVFIPAFRSFGDTTAQFEASAHKIIAPWQEADVNFNSFANAFDAAEIGRTTVVAADTDTVRIKIDPNVVTQWAHDPENNFGLLLQPLGPTFMKRFSSINSTRNAPWLKISYQDSSGSGALRTAEVIPLHDAFIFETLQAPEEGPLYVANGLAARSLLRFDLSAIPQGATVNRAVLNLTVDHAHSYLDSLEGIVFSMYPVIEETSNALTTAIDSSRVLSLQLGVVVDSTKTLSIRFQESGRPNQVQFWSFGTDENHGLVLRPAFGGQDLWRVAFFGATSDSTKSPQLVVEYTPPAN